MQYRCGFSVLEVGLLIHFIADLYHRMLFEVSYWCDKKQSICCVIVCMYI